MTSGPCEFVQGGRPALWITNCLIMIEWDRFWRRLRYFNAMKITGAFVLGGLLFGGIGCGQEKEVNPFNSVEWQRQDLLAKTPESWEVMLEVFSLPFGEAAKLRRNQKVQAKIYGELVKRSEVGKAVLEEFVLLVGKVGTTGVAESIEEMIYPTEYEPPEIPNKVRTVPQNPEVAKLLMTPAAPTAFDRKDMGTRLEVLFDRKETPEMIEVAVDFDRVEFLDFANWGQGKAAAKMPEFAAQGFKKTVFLKSQIPVMVGTMSPPKVRADKGGERRVWFAFATATPSER